MKIYTTLFLLLISAFVTHAQSDSISRYVNMYPLFQSLDSLAQQFERNGYTVDLVFYESSQRLQQGLILWKMKEKYYGKHFTQRDSKVTNTKIATRKIKKVLSSRLFSDSCDLCELYRGEKKADIDHHYNLYLKRNTGSKCNEMYFISSAYLFYAADNCIWDIREVIAL